MTLTENRLSEILTEKLETLRSELIASFARDLQHQVNGLTASLNTIKTTANFALNKAKACEERLTILEQAEVPDTSTIQSNSDAIKKLQNEHVVLNESVDRCNTLITEQEEIIDDLRNRSLRTTLVFKGIEEPENEKTWADTEKNLVDMLHKVDPNIPVQVIYPCQYTRVAKFFSWKDSEKVKHLFTTKNAKDPSFKVYCCAKYGPLTTARRNLAMAERRKLITNGEAAKAFVAYPAKLMVAANRRDKTYRVAADFSKHVMKKVKIQSEGKVDG